MEPPQKAEVIYQEDEADEDEDGVEPVRVVDSEFVEQVKRDAAASPSTEDTVSTENKPTEESES